MHTFNHERGRKAAAPEDVAVYVCVAPLFRHPRRGSNARPLGPQTRGRNMRIRESDLQKPIELQEYDTKAHSCQIAVKETVSGLSYVR
jgi:hypothetical protein